MTKHINYNAESPYRNRDKEKTKAIFLKAVGTVLKAKGFEALGVNEISREAGHDKKLIAYHFGCYQNMIDEYLRDKKIWAALFQQVFLLKDDPSRIDLEIFLKHVYYNLIDQLKEDLEMRQLLLWNLSKPIKSMSNLNQEWENQINHFILKAKPKEERELRALLALLYGGICTSFFAATTGFSISPFGQLNFNDEDDLGEFTLAVGFPPPGLRRGAEGGVVLELSHLCVY
ncbi:AcrR family transcriptional regulator [Pedobacter africanus]|uniref:AcrR family transcriptional regulator n=1 Tax=Pedobacter africanus TaxID=151894 RepID=A0ACC6L3H2_9SPHI|nr:TetR/AcrR family transcriptional regulator [Pedobacter africanus]MDR6786057.1 AcrR family transcriptional regulator [Pedobacter africanus]